MINWGNLDSAWWFLPILIGVVIVLYTCKFKYNLLRILKINEFSFTYVGLFSYQIKIILKTVLWLISLTALYVALLAPRWGKYEQIVPQLGRNIIIALDVSRSMLAEDFKPNRLLFAKSKIKKLTQELAGDRVGLILFAGDALVMCPLTRDRELLMTFLDDATVQTISSGTTNLTSAVKTATKMMSQANDKETNLLVIFTDGEDFAGGLAEAAQEAKAAAINIFTIGVATIDGAPIPNSDTEGKQLGFIKDDNGNIVISRLRPDNLQLIAQQTNGKNVVAQVQDYDLQEIVNWVKSFERNNLADKNLVVQAEKYYYFAAAALVALLIEWVL